MGEGTSVQPDAPARGYLSSAEAARYLGLHLRYVQEETKAGRIKSHRFGRVYRYTQAQLDDYAAERAT